MIINFENIASHKYLEQKSKSLWMARSEMTEHSFPVLIQKMTENTILKIPVANLCRLNKDLVAAILVQWTRFSK